MRRIVWLGLCAAALLGLQLGLTSCGGQLSDRGISHGQARYAKGFQLIAGDVDRGGEIAVFDPRAEDTVRPLMRYRIGDRLYLSDTLVELEGAPRRIACLSSTHVAFLTALGVEDRIVAVGGIDYISNPYVRAAYRDGKIRDIGSEMSLRYETLIAQRPDLVLAFATTNPRPEFVSRLHELGIPVFMVGDFLEEHPLGRAEWIRAIGFLLGASERADSVFNRIDSEYTALASRVESASARPRVMLNAPWKETWYIPGGKTYMSRFIKDAGAEPMCAGFENDAMSHPVNLEVAIAMGMDADFWLNPGGANSIRELLAMNGLFEQFQPISHQHVWNNNARSNGAGGNDFWETGVIEPHRILADLIAIFHPDLVPNHEYAYYKHLPLE